MKPSELLKEAAALEQQAELLTAPDQAIALCKQARILEAKAYNYRLVWAAVALDETAVGACEQNAHDTIKENPSDYTTEDFYYLCCLTAQVEYDAKI